MLPSILREELAMQKIPCAVLEQHSSQNKQSRILGAFDARLAARALSAHENVKKTPFIQEMMDWQPLKTGGYDDGLDAVAGALSLEPVRMKHSYFSARHRWHNNKPHQASTEFEV